MQGARADAHAGGPGFLWPPPATRGASPATAMEH